MKTPPHHSHPVSGGPTPLEDGVYQVSERHHLLLHRGALHMPADMVPSAVPIDCASLVHVVMTQTGWTRSFVRASHLAVLCPHLAPTMQRLAARLGCSL